MLPNASHLILAQDEWNAYFCLCGSNNNNLCLPSHDTPNPEVFPLILPALFLNDITICLLRKKWLEWYRNGMSIILLLLFIIKYHVKKLYTQNKESDVKNDTCMATNTEWTGAAWSWDQLLKYVLETKLESDSSNFNPQFLNYTSSPPQARPPPRPSLPHLKLGHTGTGGHKDNWNKEAPFCSLLTGWNKIKIKMNAKQWYKEVEQEDVCWGTVLKRAPTFAAAIIGSHLEMELKWKTHIGKGERRGIPAPHLLKEKKRKPSPHTYSEVCNTCNHPPSPTTHMEKSQK